MYNTTIKHTKVGLCLLKVVSISNTDCILYERQCYLQRYTGCLFGAATILLLLLELFNNSAFVCMVYCVVLCEHYRIKMYVKEEEDDERSE